TQKKQRLTQAADLFARCGDAYSAQPPTRAVDRQYQKLADLRRADCAFEMGNFGQAIAQYQAVASRWPDDPVALAACVQVANAFAAMNRTDDVRTANERVRALLARMPQGAFAETGMTSGAGGGGEVLE